MLLVQLIENQISDCLELLSTSYFLHDLICSQSEFKAAELNRRQFSSNSNGYS